MKLLHPIEPKEGNDSVRVIVVVRGFSRNSWPERGGLALDYLGLVCNTRAYTAAIGDSLADKLSSRSLLAALEKIDLGEVDLVIATDLSQISRRMSSALASVSKCVASGVRVITFEDRFDTADEDWKEELQRSLAPIAEDCSITTEGGQP